MTYLRPNHKEYTKSLHQHTRQQNPNRNLPTQSVNTMNYFCIMSSQFRYLGSIIQKDGEINSDVNHKIQASWLKWRIAIGVLCDRNISLWLKGKFYRTAISFVIWHGMLGYKEISSCLEDECRKDAHTSLDVW